ncbi:competence protein [Virgibacillus halodenitrificans]|nr:competence protein [Virgibacillus halodenitrificans]MYL56524.1 competence protein [Virgibacillus halodenitrificans]
MLNDLYTPLPEITPMTLALIASRDRKENRTTQVVEEDTEYLVQAHTSRLIDQSCKYFGSSLKGRQEGTREICGITYKAPITINPSSGMYFFPTNSPSNSNCCWIAHSHIDQVNQAQTSGTEIIFKNGKKIFITTSYGIVLNQIQRTAQYRYLLDKRLQFLQKHHADRVAESPFS